MIKTATTFTTDNEYLQTIYDNAEQVLLSSVKSFGDRRVLTVTPSADRMTLHSEVLGAATLSARDTEAALNTVRAFLATQREDGRLADSIYFRDGAILAKYEKLAGLCFAEEALGLYYLTRKKDAAYLEALLAALERFDNYLWEHHDLNFNRCLEIFDESETEEGVGAGRYGALHIKYEGQTREVSPFPIESADLMAAAVSIRHTIARIYTLRNDTENARAWMLKAIDVQSHLKKEMWSERQCFCYDIDYRRRNIDTLAINNLYMMYYGAFDREMAQLFVNRHLNDPDKFYTPMPLPGVSATDPHFSGGAPDFNRYPRGMSYRRAIGALEKYGCYSLLTALGHKLLDAVADGVFGERFDPMSGAVVPRVGDRQYTPTAATALELLARFYGVCQELDHLHWGALGHSAGHNSEFCFRMAGDDLRLVAEEKTSSGFIGEERLFTVTNGMRVITDLYGDGARVINVTDRPIDGVFVYRDRTYSFCLAPDEVFDVSAVREEANVNKMKKVKPNA